MYERLDMHGYSYTRQGWRVFVTCPKGVTIIVGVAIAARDEGVREFFRSLTKEQFVKMFKDAEAREKA